MPINILVPQWSKVKVGDRRENTSSHPERIEGAHRTMAERRTLAAYLNRIPAPLLVFLGGGIGAFCRIHTPGGVLAANLIGSFTLGLLTALWASHARMHGEDAVRSFRFLFGAGMMGGYTTYSSIAAVTAQAVFIHYTVHGWYVLLSLAVLFIGGLVAAASGLFTGGKSLPAGRHAVPVLKRTHHVLANGLSARRFRGNDQVFSRRQNVAPAAHRTLHHQPRIRD